MTLKGQNDAHILHGKGDMRFSIMYKTLALLTCKYYFCQILLHSEGYKKFQNVNSASLMPEQDI